MFAFSGSVGYLGPEGSHSHSAAKKLCAPGAVPVAYDYIDDIFSAVDSGSSRHGIVPYANSIGGDVHQTLDSFQRTKRVMAYAELDLPVRHALVGRGKPGDIEAVYSHPQAIDQCYDYLKNNLPGARKIAAKSTSEAVQKAAADASAAAIGSVEAAALYGVPVIDECIAETETAFLALANHGHPHEKNRAYRTLMVYGLEGSKNTPGVLYDSLVPFKEHGINLRHIESRPLLRSHRPRLGDYAFYVVADGHADDANLGAALDELCGIASFAELKGSFVLL